MPPGPENPYPISDQNIRISIPYFRPDSQNVYPISDRYVWQLRQHSIDLRRTGLRNAPNDVHVYFFFAINVQGSTRYSKNGIPGQTDGMYTLFQTKMVKSIPYFRLEMLENDTLWGGPYLYGLYMGVPPPGKGTMVMTNQALISEANTAAIPESEWKPSIPCVLEHFVEVGWLMSIFDNMDGNKWVLCGLQIILVKKGTHELSQKMRKTVATKMFFSIVKSDSCTQTWKPVHRTAKPWISKNMY